MNWDRESRWTRIRFFLDEAGSSAGTEFAKRAVHLLRDLTPGDACWITIDNTVLAQAVTRGAPPIKFRDMPALTKGSETLRDGEAWLVRTSLRDRTDGQDGRVGDLTLRVREENAPHPGIIEFLDTVGELIAGRLKQQERVEQIQEQLREARTRTASASSHINLKELLASPSMATVRADAEAAVMGDATVLILGESGTGKTRLANAIAEASGRGPVVRATLGASDDLNTITSELFGHVRGAFSGAVAARKGLVEYADGGTLILDEVLNLPPHAQQLLLDFTQFGTYRPLGYQAATPKTATVRLIAATNGDIRRAITDTRFRQDLYFRLAAIPITLPPLRNRRADIPALAKGYLDRFDRLTPWTLSADAHTALLGPELEWAGNIRELEGLVQRAIHRARAENPDDAHVIEPRHLGLLEAGRASALPLEFPSPYAPSSHPPPSTPARPASNAPLCDTWRDLESARDTLDAQERRLIDDAMSSTGGVANRAARLLGIPRTSLLSRMKRLGIDKDAYKADA